MPSATTPRLPPRLRPPNSPLSWLLSPSTLSLLAVVARLPRTNAYSWSFQGNPQQCQNLTINLTGNDGTPPFRVLTIPFGASPLPNNTEVRRITEQMFPDNQRSVSFQLKYPANSQFVTVVSDASGFGTGGTSVTAQVGGSSDSSCFDPTQNVSPDFVFSMEPPNQVVQCQPMRLWWAPGNVQGTPNFLGVIPGGQSFAIPQGPITQVNAQGTGFSWTPNLRTGTTLMLVGGDNRGNGTAGSVFNVVSAGINPNSGCLDNSSPSSTPGSPAGGSYPTGNGGSVGGDNGSGGSGSSSGGSNTGAIAGGVIAGVVVILAAILTLFFLRRRSQNKKRAKERPVDLFHEYEDEEEGDVHQQPPDSRPTNQLEYIPEPFMVPDPTLASETDGHSQFAGTSSGRPLSGTSHTYSRSGTPDLLGGSQGGYGWGAAGSTTTTSRKGQPIRMRPVNIVQHEDAGPPVPKDEEPETIELPPAYTALNTSTPTTPAATTGENNKTTPRLGTAAGTATPGDR